MNTHSIALWSGNPPRSEIINNVYESMYNINPFIDFALVHRIASKYLDDANYKEGGFILNVNRR